MKTAEWLGYKKTEVGIIPLWWLYKGLNYMNAEGEGQESLNEHNRNKTR